ncbi:MAG: lytic transglycosylase domain-containing protein [Sphingobium sp.]|nr:MAG: lytic transglycosylase domain-containing protein [Sphingobium sp.]
MRLFGNAPAFGQDAAEQVQPRTIDIASHVAEASQRFGLPESWIYAVMRTESAGRIGAVSPAGAMGLMQLMPGTWARQRTRVGLGADPFDPRNNILAGTSYLREMYDSYGAYGFLAAYNAGPGRYEDWRDRGRPLPSETRAYVARIGPMLQTASAPTVVASTPPAQPIRISWAQSQLFAVRSNADADAPSADIDEASGAPPLAPSRPLSGLFAPVSGSRSQ